MPALQHDCDSSEFLGWFSTRMSCTTPSTKGPPGCQFDAATDRLFKPLKTIPLQHVVLDGKGISMEEWKEFKELILRWHDERGATSSITTMAICASYQQIMAKGPRVVPLIMKQLEEENDEPDMWFWALRFLTGANPVKEEQQGDIVAMSKAWRGWWRTNKAHYVWWQ